MDLRHPVNITQLMIFNKSIVNSKFIFSLIISVAEKLLISPLVAVDQLLFNLKSLAITEV